MRKRSWGAVTAGVQIIFNHKFILGYRVKIMNDLCIYPYKDKQPYSNCISKSFDNSKTSKELVEDMEK